MAFSLRAIRPLHGVGILAAIVAFIAGFGWLEILHTQAPLLKVDGDQLFYVIFAKLFLNPHLYNQGMFAEEGFKNFPVTGFTGVIAMLSPYLDLVGALRVLELGSTFFYVLSMFICLFILTGRKGISLFIAMVSAFPFYIYPYEIWGTFSFKLTMARSVFLPLCPPILLGWLLWQDSPRRLYLIYFLFGLVSIPYPVPIYSLLPGMLLAQWFHKRFSWGAFKEAAICAVCAIVPMIPLSLKLIGALHPAAALPPAEFPQFKAAFYYRFAPLSPSGLINGLLSGFPQLAGWLVLAGLGFAQIQGRVRDLLLTLSLIILASLAGVMLLNYGVLFPLRHLPVEIINICRIPRMLMLPLLMTSALYLARIRTPWRLTLVSLLLLLPASLNGGRLVQDVQKGTSLNRLLNHQLSFAKQRYFLRQDAPAAAKQDERALRELLQWVRTHTSPGKSLLHLSAMDMKPAMYLMALGERNVTYTAEHFGSLVLVNPLEFIAWNQRIHHVQQLIQQGGACSPAEIRYSRTLFPQISHFVCTKRDKPTLPDSSFLRVYENAGYIVYQAP